MELDEILAALDGVEGGDSLREQISAHFGQVAEGANARIAELEAEVQSLRDKYTETAARNYELLTSMTGEAKEEGEGAAEGDEEAEDFQEDVTDLFKERD